MTLPSRLRLYAQQWEDQHAPENVTRALREAADEIERLTAEVDVQTEKRRLVIWRYNDLRAENAKLRAALEQINVGDGWAALIARAALTAQEKQND